MPNCYHAFSGNASSITKYAEMSKSFGVKNEKNLQKIEKRG